MLVVDTCSSASMDALICIGLLSQASDSVASQTIYAGLFCRQELRGQFGMYVPSVLNELGLAEVKAKPKNNRMGAK